MHTDAYEKLEKGGGKYGKCGNSQEEHREVETRFVDEQPNAASPYASFPVFFFPLVSASSVSLNLNGLFINISYP